MKVRDAMTAADEKVDTGIKSVQLAFDVLETIAAAQEELGVSELAQALGTTKGTVFRHLQTLVQRGYCQQNAATSRYRLGLRARLLGRTASSQGDVSSACEAAARELREELGETVVVCGLDRRTLVVLDTMLGKSPLEIGVREGSELTLHATAQGKAMLAFAHPSAIPPVRARPLPALTEHTITSPAALTEEIEGVRRRGWALAPNEDTLGINALAAPVLDASGSAIGTIAVVGSIQFIKTEPSRQQIDAVLRAATKSSWLLGFKGSIP